MTELSKRWDDAPNQEARKMVYKFATTGVVGYQHREPPGPMRLKESVEKLRADNHADYRKLFPDPNLLEGIAILVKRGGVDFEVVRLTLGYQFPYRWSLWQPTVIADRDENSPEIYEAFEWPAKKIAAATPESPQVNRLNENGEVEWKGFKE
jgi:hypothetical protein